MIKSTIKKHADTENETFFEILRKSSQLWDDFVYYGKNYRTNTYVQSEFEKERAKKWENKKTQIFPHQLTLDF